VAFQSSDMRGRPSICIRCRQAGRRPELMQRTQAVHVPFHSSEMRGRPSIFIRGHEVAKRKIANDFIVSPFLQHIVLRNPFP